MTSFKVFNRLTVPKPEIRSRAYDTAPANRPGEAQPIHGRCRRMPGGPQAGQRVMGAATSQHLLTRALAGSSIVKKAFFLTKAFVMCGGAIVGVDQDAGGRDTAELTATPGRRPRARGDTVTIYDVASKAGVTIGIVSQALNGRGRMRPETRERIQEAAKALGFHPNDLAHSLLRGRSFSVGLLSTDSYGRFSIPVMSGIEDALGAAQVSVYLCDAREDPERERRYLDSLLSKRVDGMIVTARRT